MAKKKTNRKSKKSGLKTGIALTALLAFVFSLFFYLVFLRPATNFELDEATILIPNKKAEKVYVKPLLSNLVKPVQFTTFLVLADWFGYWDHIKPGRYVIKNGASIFNIFRHLHGGKQTPVKLTINKLRTKKDLAVFIGEKLECSTSDLFKFINNADSLSDLGLDPDKVMTIIIPNTYDIYWNTSPRTFLERMQKESNKFWTNSRLEKVKNLEISKEEVYIVASIIEEETNDNDEKPIMASLYLNRMRKGMNLGADPTIKFAVGDFSIKRVTFNHINSTASNPYNTYKNKGLPPGPICTPSIPSIDAVLKGVKTDYLYFCAKPDFSGNHNFASSDVEHMENAKKYRRFLDSLRIH